MSKTDDNLQAAFTGESKASTTYLAFARKADQEGFKQVARLFRAAANAEIVHARNHLQVMGKVNATRENLQASIEGENYEHKKMYPDFIQQANSDGNKKATNSFDMANKVEMIHEQLYAKALKSLETGEPPAAKPIFVCQVCGNTVEGEAPEKCPVCGANRSMFFIIE